jgi:hypothetical protein
MSKNSLADVLSAARQMVTALGNNAADLTGRGAGPDFIAAGQTLLTQLEGADAEQERLKSQLKLATAQVEDLNKRMLDWQSEASSVVKLAYRTQQEKWLEFGVKAKK